MKTRQQLKKSILLCGESDGAAFRRTFNIVKKIGEDSSAICYEAYYGSSGRGVLTEFYPQDESVLLERKNDQLVCNSDSEDDREYFNELKNEYIQPYKMLSELIKNSEDNELAAFVPAFEIYYGCNEDSAPMGSAYIWRPLPKAESFESVCARIHKAPESIPEQKLFTVLTAVISLTECVNALHSAGMLHRNIAPHNFGFMKRGNKILAETLTMLDLSSVCPADKAAAGCSTGTAGFCEPEAASEKADARTDLYSIGAMLFYAIIVSEETKADGYTYKPEYYGRLREMTAESELIAASEANSHPRLRNILVKILRKCLCERADRYSDGRELLEDLKAARYYIEPYNASDKKHSSAKWVLAESERSLDNGWEKNSVTALQYQLYEYPLYKYLSENDSEINVLVIGFGNYGQKFLDSVLQAGQMYGKTLNVTVISADAADKEIYLDERPGLAKFFNIDGSLDGVRSYGNISFETEKLEFDSDKENAVFADDIISIYFEDRKLHYVFAALGDDRINRITAEACQKTLNENAKEAVISYVSENGKPDSKAKHGLCPVYVNADIKKLKGYPDIARMAFNTHLLWEKDLNCDYNAVKKDFRKSYNRNSSMASVLSVKYKLHTMGIDLDELGFEKAAAEFKKAVSDSENNELRDELICDEHSRWVVDKLCRGWQNFDSISECIKGRSKDEKRKRHICIAKSEPKRKLSGYKESDWNESGNLDELDELDRISVELHREYRKYAAEIRKQNLLSEGIIENIRTLIFGYAQATVAFDEWLACMKEIWNKDRSSLKNYKNLKIAFLNAAEELPEKTAEDVRTQVDLFDKVFFPIRASLEFRDWKTVDAAIIDNIPFVLTYTQKLCMVIPFSADRNADKSLSSRRMGLFGDLAAPTAASPSNIIYLYRADCEESINDLKAAVPFVVSYMKKKNFKAAVEFVIIHSADMSGAVNDDLRDELITLGGKRIKRVIGLEVDDAKRISSAAAEYLKKRSSDFDLLAAEKNNTNLSDILDVTGFYDEFPSYRFDQKLPGFKELSGCDALGYISKKPYITVTDMAALGLAVRRSSNQPEFADSYISLWKKYCGDNDSDGRYTWKVFCKWLGDHAEQKDCLYDMEKSEAGRNRPPQELTYIMPAFCVKSVKKIIDILKQHGFLSDNSRVQGSTADCCRVNITPVFGSRELYNRLFANIYALMQPDLITYDMNAERGRLKIFFDDLTVTDLPLPDRRDHREKFKKLLEFFSNKHYIINYDSAGSGNSVSFTYASKQIKELLTIEGKILEIYVYYAAKKSGLFDDVVTGIELEWNNSGVRNEFDCILTKGFRTIFVECKARRNINAEPYYKLKSLTDQFGINAVPVMITDTNENIGDSRTANNVTQRERGEMMDIVTVWEQSDIENIAPNLLRILDGTYNKD